MASDRTIVIEGVTLHLAHPDELPVRWVGQKELMRELLAAWLVVEERDLPMNPRLLGKPGVGKTTLAYAAAREMGRDAYIYQATMDTRPEDLLVTPVLAESGKIAYHASPLVTAIIGGGICILDEGNRMNEKSWASLAPLLDHRRYVESVVAGITVNAHKDFRCAVTMNQDDSTYEIPDYRLEKPTFTVRQVRKGEECCYEISGDLNAPVPPIRDSKYLSKQQGINAVEHASMPGQQCAGVFDVRAAFDQRFDQVSQLRSHVQCGR